jgi:hypothetical protein
MSGKKAPGREVSVRYRQASGKEKSVILGEFVKSSRYNRKYAIRLLNQYGKETTMVAGGQAVKIKSARPRRPGSRKGRPIYGLEVVNVLRSLRKFHRFKRGKHLAVIIRKNIGFIGQSRNPDFHVTPEAREKLLKISPAQIDRLLKPDRAALQARGISGANSGIASLMKRIPVRTRYSNSRRTTPPVSSKLTPSAFMPPPLRGLRFGRIQPHPDRYRRRPGLDGTYRPPEQGTQMDAQGPARNV